MSVIDYMTARLQEGYGFSALQEYPSSKCLSKIDYSTQYVVGMICGDNLSKQQIKDVHAQFVQCVVAASRDDLMTYAFLCVICEKGCSVNKIGFVDSLRHSRVWGQIYVRTWAVDIKQPHIYYHSGLPIRLAFASVLNPMLEVTSQQYLESNLRTSDSDYDESRESLSPTQSAVGSGEDSGDHQDQPVSCTYCGVDLLPNTRYCSQCGRQVTNRLKDQLASNDIIAMQESHRHPGVAAESNMTDRREVPTNPRTKVVSFKDASVASKMGRTVVGLAGALWTLIAGLPADIIGWIGLLALCSYVLTGSLSISRLFEWFMKSDF